MLIDCVDNAALLGTLSGSMGPADAGGVVASRNQFGPYCKPRVTPTDTITPRRTQERSEWTAINSTWNDLTPSERRSWAGSAAAHSGGMTARNWFYSINQPQQLAYPGVPPLREPPTDPHVPGFDNLRLLPPNPLLDGVLIEFDALTPPPPQPGLFRPTVCRIQPVSPSPTGETTWLFNNRPQVEIPSHANSWFFQLPTTGHPPFLDQIYPSTLYLVHVRIVYVDGRRSRWQSAASRSLP